MRPARAGSGPELPAATPQEPVRCREGTAGGLTKAAGGRPAEEKQRGEEDAVSKGICSRRAGKGCKTLRCARSASRGIMNEGGHLVFGHQNLPTVTEIRPLNEFGNRSYDPLLTNDICMG